MWVIRGSCSQSIKLWFMKLWRHPSRQLRSFTKTRTHASHTPMPQWFSLLWKRHEAKGRHLNQADSQITGVKLIAHSPLTHTHTHGSLCVNFYINKPVSFSGLEEHTLRCTKCVNILQTADRLTANHVSLSSAHLITLTVVAVHVAAAEVQQHVGTQSAVRVLPASLRRAFTDDWAFPRCPAETQHFLFLCLTCWKKEMGYRASEVRPGWHKMTALIFAFNAVSCCAVLGSVVINIVCQANRVM